MYVGFCFGARQINTWLPVNLSIPTTLNPLSLQHSSINTGGPEVGCSSQHFHPAHRKRHHAEYVAGRPKQLFPLPPSHREASEDAFQDLLGRFDIAPQQLQPQPVVAPELCCMQKTTELLATGGSDVRGRLKIPRRGREPRKYYIKTRIITHGAINTRQGKI